MGGANWLESELGSVAAWRAERTSLVVEPVPDCWRRVVVRFFACRRFGCSFAQASILSEQVTEETIEDLGGD